MPKPFAALLLTAFVTLLLPGPVMSHSGHDHPSVDEGDPSAQQSQKTAEPRFRASPGKGKPPHSPTSDYKLDNLHGWTLHVHKDLVADTALWEVVRAEMAHQLYGIIRVVPAEKVKLLKQVPVWIELNNPYSNNCQYHPSKRWLEANGYLSEKANAVEISNAKRFVGTSRSIQPFVMLHELAHAYHDLHLGFNHKGIVEAYKKAKASGSYDSVLHMVGRNTRAYAMTDHKEYFAEASEAYFGRNDFYPFVRPELKKHDPVMYEMVREVWGLKK